MIAQLCLRWSEHMDWPERHWDRGDVHMGRRLRAWKLHKLEHRRTRLNRGRPCSPALHQPESCRWVLERRSLWIRQGFHLPDIVGGIRTKICYERKLNYYLLHSVTIPQVFQTTLQLTLKLVYDSESEVSE